MWSMCPMWFRRHPHMSTDKLNMPVRCAPARLIRTGGAARDNSASIFSCRLLRQPHNGS